MCFVLISKNNTFGKNQQYFPIITKNRYFNFPKKEIIDNFFNESTSNFASYFTKNENLNLTELEEIKNNIENKNLVRKNYRRNFCYSWNKTCLNEKKMLPKTYYKNYLFIT